MANQFGYIMEQHQAYPSLYQLHTKYDEEINDILESLHKLVDSNEDTKFVKQVHLIETFKDLNHHVENQNSFSYNAIIQAATL